MPDFLHGIETVEIDNGIRPIQTVRSSVIGLVGTAADADVAQFPLDEPVLVSGPRAAALLGDAGTLKDAYNAVYAMGVSSAVIVRVAEDADDAQELANVVGSAADQTGVYALMNAKALLGLTPRLLAAPGYTFPADPAAKNPVAAALEIVAPRLRAIAYVDGPGTNETDEKTYAALFSTGRVWPIGANPRFFDDSEAAVVTMPASAYAAGRQSWLDNERGFWWSLSNQDIPGMVAASRPIQFAISDPETEANRLNEVGVLTIIRDDGFRFWGNRIPSSDPLWAFVSVRRTADMIYETIEQSHRWALDRPFSQQLLLDIRDGVQSYLDRLTALGALLGGQVWIDEELNTEATLKAGQLYLSFDIEPPAPLERLTFHAYRNGEYYEELIADVNQAA